MGFDTDKPMSALGRKQTVQRALPNVRLRWKADVQNNQLECLLNTESGRSGVNNDRHS